MRKFKRFDFFTSATLIVMFTAISLTKMDDTFMIAYLVVGAWQLISMIVHAVAIPFSEWGRTRFVYHCLSAVLLGTIALGSFWLLLFLAPPMALFYTALCYHETFFKRRRPLALLK